jgi:hypothetical protein
VRLAGAHAAWQQGHELVGSTPGDMGQAAVCWAERKARHVEAPSMHASAARASATQPVAMRTAHIRIDGVHLGPVGCLPALEEDP